jgi:hypothetical protein
MKNKRILVSLEELIQAVFEEAETHASSQEEASQLATETVAHILRKAYYN